MRFLGGDKAISLIKDPFLKGKVDSIWISGGYGIFHPHTFKWSAQITFKNGNTKGEQKTEEYEDFNQVVAELDIILKNLK